MTNKSKLFKAITEGKVGDYTKSIYRRTLKICMATSGIGLLVVTLLGLFETITPIAYGISSIVLIIILLVSNLALDYFEE